jgi:hypothetical protein
MTPGWQLTPLQTRRIIGIGSGAQSLPNRRSVDIVLPSMNVHSLARTIESEHSRRPETEHGPHLSVSRPSL